MSGKQIIVPSRKMHLDFRRLRCAGTVRPRQVQCPLGWPAIAQVSASQHQLVSLQTDINVSRPKAKKTHKYAE